MWVCNCVHMHSTFSFSNLLQFKSGRVKPQASLSLGFCPFTSVFYSSLPFHITPPSPPKQIIIFIISFSSSTSLTLKGEIFGGFTDERERERSTWGSLRLKTINKREACSLRGMLSGSRTLFWIISYYSTICIYRSGKNMYPYIWEMVWSCDSVVGPGFIPPNYCFHPHLAAFPDFRWSWWSGRFWIWKVGSEILLSSDRYLFCLL